MTDVLKQAAEAFANDTRTHSLKILRDDGLYRHVRCEQPAPYAWNQWWEVVTWPDRLAITGDMGSYVFSRVEDMFEFFRHPRREQVINPRYWREKLLASDCRASRGDGVVEYSPDKFREAVSEYLSARLEDYGEALTTGQRAELRRSVELDVLAYADDGEQDAREAVEGYCDPLCSGGRKIEGWRALDFPDFWERNLTEYTPRYLWCLHAIVWTIHGYDGIKEGAA